MFVIEGQQADAEIREHGEVDAIIQHLSGQGYRPTLRAMLRAVSEVASVDPHSLRIDAVMRGQVAFRRPYVSPVPPGELLFKDNQAYILQPMGRHLHAWEIRPHSVESALGSFGTIVESAARASLDGRRLRGMDFTWKVIKERPVRRLPARARFYQEVKLESKAPDYTVEEASAIQLLVPAEQRNFLLRLAQVGKARLVDTATEVDAALASRLLDAGLVRKEYLVLCRQDSHTICALQDRTELESGQGAFFVCTICGRQFKDELVQEIFTLTDLGRSLLRGSRWMTIWVTDLLITSGIRRELIAWNAVAGEDELDIMTDALGPRVFVELKDREFGLGDAYPFAYRVTRYGGTFGIVVSTDRVAEEAKRFFQEQRSAMEAQIECLEGPEGIHAGIPTLIDRVSRSGVFQLVQELSDAIGVNLAPILQAWMDRAAIRATSNTPVQPPLGAVRGE